MTDTTPCNATPLASNIWTWYGQDEYRRIILLAELGLALEFLALDAERQRAEISCCAECNLWSDYLDGLDGFVKHFPACLAPALQQRLHILLGSCEALCWEAYVGTPENNGFEHPQWQPLREQARQVLDLLGWQTVREHINELAQDCRAALKKWPD